MQASSVKGDVFCGWKAKIGNRCCSIRPKQTTEGLWVFYNKLPRLLSNAQDTTFSKYREILQCSWKSKLISVLYLQTSRRPSTIYRTRRVNKSATTKFTTTGMMRSQLSISLTKSTITFIPGYLLPISRLMNLSQQFY